ncbi:MAG: hypothetical protein AB8G95_20405 [Anaerolineae bacterium]
MIKKLRLVIGLMFLSLLTVCNGRLYAKPIAEPDFPAKKAQLAHIRSELNAGLGADMQQLFPEGYFFSYALYGLAAVNVGLSEPNPLEKTFLLEEARWAYAQIDSPAGRASFPKNLSTEYGIFYNGWSNYLLAGILLLQDGVHDPVELARFEQESADIAQALATSQSPFLDSYSGQIWPVDTFPAMVSLKAYKVVTDDARFEPLIEEWLQKIQDEIDPVTGLIPHRTEPFVDTGRATSQTLILWFLAELDPELTESYYRSFREQFVVGRLGIPAVREFPAGDNRLGDIDSGPLITGVSLSATVVMLGTARMVGDVDLAQAIYQEGEAGGWPLQWRGERFYGAGVLPIGEAFLLWAQTARPWLADGSMQVDLGWPWWWRLPTHLVSLLLVGAWLRPWVRMR